MAQVLAGILAVIKAIPIIDKWFQKLVALYVNAEIDRMDKENRDAVKTAIEKFDQRELEKAIGNPNAGGASGIPGTITVPALPGVPK